MPLTETLNGNAFSIFSRIGVFLTLLATLAVIVSYSVSITSKLDHISSVASMNCDLLKNAIILSISESRPQTPRGSKISDQILANFQNITCG